MSNKVTPFRRPSQLTAETPIDGRIVFEVGADRFAIDYAITELNQKPAQVIPIQRKAMAKEPRRRTQTIMTSRRYKTIRDPPKALIHWASPSR